MGYSSGLELESAAETPLQPLRFLSRVPAQLGLIAIGDPIHHTQADSCEDGAVNGVCHGAKLVIPGEYLARRSRR
jgi:hypothetical protein